MSLDVLAFMAVVLTLAMFVTRNSMLGFPSAIMWAILGGYSYTLSITDWDIYFILFFACTFGMTIFTIFAAYGLREPRDTIGEESMEHEDKQIEAEGLEGEYLDEGEKPQSRSERVRERAAKRRGGR